MWSIARVYLPGSPLAIARARESPPWFVHSTKLHDGGQLAPSAFSPLDAWRHCHLRSAPSPSRGYPRAVSAVRGGRLACGRAAVACRDGGQRLIKIGDEIVRAFDADRETQECVGDAAPLALLDGKRAMR